jgi:uncharacterized OsmC-like protein
MHRDVSTASVADDPTPDMEVCWVSLSERIRFQRWPTSVAECLFKEVSMADLQIRTALEKLSKTITSQPENAKAKHSPATAILKTGMKCRVTGPADEQIETDMPAAMGGAASGPNPGWFFRASLASCCATVIAMRAACLGVNLTMLEVVVESDGDHRGILGLDDRISAGMSSLRTAVRIGADNANPEQLAELVRWAEKHSPVGCTVREAPTNTLDIRIM